MDRDLALRLVEAVEGIKEELTAIKEELYWIKTDINEIRWKFR